MPNRPALPLALAFLLFAPACSPGPGNQQEVVGNAIAADERIDGEALDRADHLDELSAELAADANSAHGAARDALRNRSEADRAEAAEARAEGDSDGAAAADHIEASAGLINKQ